MTNRTDVSPIDQRDRWAGALPRIAERPPSMRVFGVVMLVGFGVLGGLLLVTSEAAGDEVRRAFGMALVAVGATIFFWSLVSPRTLPPVYRAWMSFGKAVGGGVSLVLLGVVYYAVVTPVGLLMRATGTDPLERALRRDSTSYWRRRTLATDPDAYRHMS